MRMTGLFCLIPILSTPLSAYAETISHPGYGSSTWFPGAAGLSGVQIPNTNAGNVTVSSSATVEPGRTATVTYQIGVVTDGTFNSHATYIRNLTPGANQPITKTFVVARGVEYTVKVKIAYGALAPNSHGDRTITVPP